MAGQAPISRGSRTRASSTSPGRTVNPSSLPSVVSSPVFHLPSGRRVARKTPERLWSASGTR